MMGEQWWQRQAGFTSPGESVYTHVNNNNTKKQSVWDETRMAEAAVVSLEDLQAFRGIARPSFA